MGNIDTLEKMLGETDIRLMRNVPLCGFTSFKIGGPAAAFIEPKSETELSKVTAACADCGVPTLILGNGSNLLVSDDGFVGAVIHIGSAMGGIALGNGNVIECGAGAKLSAVCAFALKNGLSGLEFAFGIPGSAGGAAVMNAGAYGGEMKDVLLEARHVCDNGEVGSLSGDGLELGYRHSAYSGGGRVISSIRLGLKVGDPAAIKAEMDDYMNRRRSRQPLEYPSAGSVFKRPEGHYAGALIEQCGLKGRRIGGAAVSEKHAGFIVNTGCATAKDVLSLIELIQETVLSQTGVALECEVKTAGM